jgi:DNA ligase (NAD+)
MKVEKLRKQIIEAAQSYYEGNPIISDAEFDALIYHLEELSPGDKLLSKISSGYEPKNERGEKVKHKYLNVGSLNKINAETCEKYFAQRPGQYCITSKIDGGSVVVYYNSHGRLDKTITRGDGKIGIDCTTKLRHIVPQDVKLSNVAVRGEVIMTKEIFAEFYPDAASPRNSAMGIIGKDEPTTEEIKRLSFVAYNIYGDNDLIPKNKSGVMEWLYESGFTPTKYTKLFDRSPLFLEGMKGKLNPEYPADGLVITNETNRFDEIAYKFVAETAETTVTKIEWETSRLGNVIPVVHFNPVKLSGAMLGKCSGFNAKWIKDNIVGKGAVIRVHRAGEVIPYCTEVLVSCGTIFPTNCPDCSTELEWKGVHLYCPNELCLKKVQSNLLHWIEKMAPVDSLGNNILVPFIYNMGWRSVSDIYNSSESKWLTQFECLPATNHAHKLLMKMNEKLYKDLVNPDKFFAAFGLPSVGESTSKKISQEIGIHEYFNHQGFIWSEVENLGKINYIALNSLNDSFKIMKGVYIQIMELQGFIEKEKATIKATIKVAITGKLSKGRKELIEEFAAHGIEVVGSVSKEVAYLITDSPDSGSSKNLAAQKLGVKVVSEEDFRSKNNF